MAAPSLKVMLVMPTLVLVHALRGSLIMVCNAEPIFVAVSGLRAISDSVGPRIKTSGKITTLP
ncbi:MAG: hypothetical protein MUO76_05000, partial [Anaerolineaceae bacterium]|nr:hypothetical protein [Anaerolineaceae bacterium]